MTMQVFYNFLPLLLPYARRNRVPTWSGAIHTKNCKERNLIENMNRRGMQSKSSSFISLHFNCSIHPNFCCNPHFHFDNPWGCATIYRVFFELVPHIKALSVRLLSESHQKSSKCQNLLTSWHLEKSC